MHDGDYAVLVFVALSSCVDWKCRIVVCNYGWPSDDIFATIREQNIRECSNTIVVDWSGSLILWNAQCLFNMYEIWGRPWYLLSLIGILHFSENLSEYNPDWNTRKTSGQEKIQTSLFCHGQLRLFAGKARDHSEATVSRCGSKTVNAQNNEKNTVTDWTTHSQIMNLTTIGKKLGIFEEAFGCENRQPRCLLNVHQGGIKVKILLKRIYTVSLFQGSFKLTRHYERNLRVSQLQPCICGHVL